MSDLCLRVWRYGMYAGDAPGSVLISPSVYRWLLKRSSFGFSVGATGAHTETAPATPTQVLFHFEFYESVHIVILDDQIRSAFIEGHLRVNIVNPDLRRALVREEQRDQCATKRIKPHRVTEQFRPEIFICDEIIENAGARHWLRIVANVLC